MKYLIPVILLVVSIALFVGTWFWTTKLEFSHLNSKAKCNNSALVAKACDNDKNCCAVWDSGAKICRKGKIQGNKCVSKGRVGPLILGIVGLLLFLAFLITFFMAIFRKKKQV